MPERAAAATAPRPAGALVPDVRKIAVLRANAIGDLIFVLPAFEALRATYPAAEIVFLGQPWHSAFLNGQPGPIDRAIPIPPSHGVNETFAAGTGEDPAELEAFFAAMRAEHFDLALQLHGGGRYSNPFLLRLGAWVTAGLRALDAPPLERWLPYVYWQNEIARYLEVVGLVGAPPVTLEPWVSLTDADRAEADAVLPQRHEPLVVLHPGAGAPRRRWPAEKFAAVGDALAARGARVAVIGARADERPLVEATLAALQAAALNLWDRVSLGGLTAVLARCRLVVSNDSGPLHLAGAVGTPAVGVYWCGNAMTAATLYRAHHRPVISWQLACAVCGRNTLTDSCSHKASFVAGMPVADVLAATEELWPAEDADEARSTVASPARTARGAA